MPRQILELQPGYGINIKDLYFNAISCLFGKVAKTYFGKVYQSSFSFFAFLHPLQESQWEISRGTAHGFPFTSHFWYLR